MENNAKILASAGFLVVSSLAIAVKLAKRKRQRLRSCWVQPWREERQRCGNIQAFLEVFNLSNDFKSYKSYILMDEICFGELLAFVESDITRKDTSMRACIPAKERLAATLRFLATGETYQELNENTRLSPSFLRYNVLEVCEAIYQNMKNKFLKFPDSKEKWLEIAEGFQTLWQFPHCLAALDGKHIAFSPQKNEEALFYNYKGFHSIVLMAMCDANCKFTFVDVGCNGRISDGGVLMRSDLMVILNRGKTVFPKPDIIGNNRRVPYVILADNAFPNMPNLITPYSRNILETKCINFNARLSRARQNIERAFGVLANRFRILQTTIKLNAEKTTKIVQCCCVLHNFLIEKSLWYRNNLNDIAISNGLNYDDNGLEDNDITTEENQKFTQKEIENIRKTFCEYFANEGNIKK